MTAYFIGAGASYGTFRRSRFCPPIGSQFGLSLQRAVPRWADVYPGLGRVVRHIGSPIERISLERMWTCIDYYAKLRRALPAAAWSRSSRPTHDLKRALLKLYGSACGDLVDRLPLSDDYTLGWLLKHRLRHGDVLISFNYDTIVERLASRFGHDLRMMSMPPSSTIQILKPHGSVGWKMDWAAGHVRMTTAEHRPILEAMAEDDVGSTFEPLLLGAVPIKSELILEVQRCYFPEVFDVVVDQWKAITDAVRDADALVIVGYGFPSEDQYGRFLLSEAMRSRSRRPIPKVEYFELASKRHHTRSAIRSAFGEPRLKPRYLGRVKPARLDRTAG